MTSLENNQTFHCSRCGGPIINVSVKKYNKVDLFGALVVGIFVFSLPAYFIITDSGRPSRWPMGIVALALAIGYVANKFIAYEVIEVVKCKYCGRDAN